MLGAVEGAVAPPDGQDFLSYTSWASITVAIIPVLLQEHQFPASNGRTTKPESLAQAALTTAAEL